jgi:hypothetical protein
MFSLSRCRPLLCAALIPLAVSAPAAPAKEDGWIDLTNLEVSAHGSRLTSEQ